MCPVPKVAYSEVRADVQPEAVRRSWSTFGRGLAFLVGMLVGVFLLRQTEAGSVKLMLDADIQSWAEDQIEVFVNQSFSAPLVHEIDRRRRRVYEFEGLPGSIRRLRIDPSVRAGVSGKIYSLTFVVGEKRFPIANEVLRQADLINGSGSFDSQSGVYSFQSGEDVRIELEPKTLLETSWLPVVPAEFARDYALWVLIGVAGSTLLLGISSMRLAALALFATGTLVCGVSFLIESSLLRGSDIPAVAQAIGYTNLFGIEKQAEFRAYWWSVGLALVLGCLAGFLSRSSRSTEVVNRSRSDVWLFTGLILWSALTYFPDFRAIFENADSVSYSGNFDTQNFYTWAYFRHRELLPFRDFWFPYSGFFYTLFTSQAPSLSGALLHFAHMTLILSSTAWCFYRLTDHSRTWCTLGTAFVAFFASYGLFDRIDRYYLAVILVLLFAGWLRYRTRGEIAVWTAFACYTSIMEPVQLMYAAPGCLLLFVVTLVHVPDRARLVRDLCCALSIFVAFIGVSLLRMYQHGQLREFFLFYATVGDAATGGMLPTAIEEWPRLPFSPEGRLLWMTLALSTSAAWLSVSRRSPKIENVLPLAIAFIAIVVFCKQLVRPHIALQLSGISFVGFFFLLYQLRPRSRWLSVWMAIGIGVAFGMLLDGYRYYHGRGVFETFVAQARRLPTNVVAMLSSRKAWEELERRYFRPDAFEVDGISGDRWRERFEHELGLRLEDDIFVLGDDPYFYIMLGKRTPFHTNLYNQALLYCQENTVRWLGEHKPRYVIWRPSFQSFDYVPNHVRVPVLFNAVIDGYQFLRTIGNFAILERRTKPIDLHYWRAVLGSEVSLGYIPSRSEIDRQNGVGASSTIMSVRVRRPQHGRKRTLVFDSAAGEWSISFFERKGIRGYEILLDRVWFWQASPTVTLRKTRERGVKVTSSKRRVSALY